MRLKSPILCIGLSTPLYAQDIEHIEVNSYVKDYSPVSQIVVGKSVLSGELLAQQKASTLGDTLSQTPSVSSSFFGSSAGRPQIRGQGGQRVLITNNGMPIRDMSAISDDQLIPIEPFFAESITVLKGARATIPFGGEAMAGIVDVNDGRIPLQQEAEKEDKVEIQTGYNAATSLLSTLGGQQNDFAYNVNLLYREHSDYKIPNTAKAADCSNWGKLVLNSQLTSQCQVSLARPTWEHDGTKFVDVTPIDEQIITHQLANSANKVVNSSYYQTNLTFGGSQRFEDEQLFGLSVNYNAANRAIPGFIHPIREREHSHDTQQSNQSGNIRIYSSQYRIDALYQKQFSANSYLNQFNVKAAYSKQSDDENLDHRRVNKFILKNWQISPTLNYQFSEQFTGTFGLFIDQSEKQGSGNNNYLPDIKAKREAAYMMQNAAFGPLSLQLGARYEEVKYTPTINSHYQPGRGLGALVQNNKYDLFNHSVSLNWDITSFWYIAASLTHAERAPGMNELYASNPHYALLIEEQGNSNLKKESNKAEEFGTGLQFKNLSITANWYENNYDDYIYLGSTGVNRGGVYVKEWRQADTLNKGFEVELNYTLNTQNMGDFSFSAYVDETKNTPVYQFDGSYNPFTPEAFFNPDEAQMAEYFRRRLEGDSIPRTPADSYGAAVHWQFESFKASVDYQHNKAQQQLAKFEHASPSYYSLGANFSYSRSLFGFENEFFININNLTNQEIRPHQSYLRYLAPQPGRSIAVGIRAKI
ncbi:TonB-dependent receptor [Pseudoalteromonas sp. L1]|uniref:TonB-dependent receptor n=1 Tax=Pseudoalteromonas sp. L1 TaxID=195716 RepID=UPI001F267814|nr:TonB-dependent receptor [Pseudoalteromonas sp. L1]